jgi:p-aminobenzoyl-glutamate transporter AbgT
MLVPLLIFALVGCLGLLAALRPEVYARYFLAESQRRALSGNLRALSFTGWIIFCGCMAVVIALPFQSKWSLLAPVFSPLFFLGCAVAYIWWGVGLLRNPESFLKRAIEPLSRLPIWAVRSFGSVLLLGAAGFLYGFVLRIKGLFR